MADLELYFCSQPQPQLIKTIFKPRLSLTSLVSVRGRTAGAYRGAGNFIWSNAVKALMLFLFEAKTQHLAGFVPSAAQSTLDGKKGDPAHSLALAIKKEPQWMVDMFGANYHGQSNIRKLIKISNLYLNMGDTLALSLNLEELPPRKVQFYFDDLPLENLSGLNGLYRNFLCNEYPSYVERYLQADEFDLVG